MPERENVGGQGDLACGFNVIWYLEDEVRCYLGDGRASRGWRNEQLVRHKLFDVCKVLEKQEVKMIEVQKSLKALEAKKEVKKELFKKMQKAIEEDAFKAKIEALRNSEEFAEGYEEDLPPLTLFLEEALKEAKELETKKAMQKAKAKAKAKAKDDEAKATEKAVEEEKKKEKEEKEKAKEKFWNELKQAQSKRARFEEWAIEAEKLLDEDNRSYCWWIKHKAQGPLCSKCRWGSTCMACDFPKAVR